MTATGYRGVCALVEDGLMCGKPIYQTGHCNMHVTRKRRHGSMFATQRIYGDDMARFMSKTRRAVDGCLRWITDSKVNGYGVFSIGDDTCLAHRWIWEQTIGPIPEGMTLDHECHNEAAARGECEGGDDCPHRACVDVTHMAVKTSGDNLRASANFGGHVTHCKGGHAFDEENTYRAKDGRRSCRACHRIWERERQARLRKEANG